MKAIDELWAVIAAILWLVFIVSIAVVIFAFEQHGSTEILVLSVIISVIMISIMEYDSGDKKR